MRRKRYFVLASSILLIFSLLLARLVQLQLVDTESFSKHHINLLEESVSQRTQEIIIDDGRGQFTDRNGKPLTYKEKSVLVLFPFLKTIQWDSEKVASILNISEDQLFAELETAKAPFIFHGKTPYILSDKQLNEINMLKIPGVFAVRKKYTESDISAAQLIGIIGEDANTFLKRYPDKKGMQNQKIGITGLQKQFDEFLLPEGESKLVFHVDAMGGPLFGINVKYTGSGNSNYPVTIQTTLNKTLQEQIDKKVDEYEIQKGGVLLLDIETNEILANVSRPKMDVKDPYKNNSVENVMLSQQIPGSIFKTVVAAASIETSAVNETEKFPCNEDLYGKPAERQLGDLTFDESFAQSCNRTFSELAKRLKKENPNLLEEYASKLGLIGEIGWQGDVFHFKNFKQLKEDQGQIFAKLESRKDDNLVAQTGIGQQEVRLTPLAIANMMATIARGGELQSVQAVSAIKYHDDTPMIHFSSHDLPYKPISKITAMKLQKMLRHVVTNENGTGRWFKDLPYEVAGKSGTAETGIYENKVQLHNKWFAGYFPFKNPKYALVVVNLGVAEDKGGINQLFSDIVQLIHENDTNQNSKD
ncbi:peptidoglycan D,D-transpeptidase FtsI family protein [Heyndrickxia sporothermodurans]|uniref:peptidoglycan D,D-transpeptidase FtsI family protein n=1 Tax=Heyndrickxia sporothermodurans TaxID=46224 RepID=UPI002E1E2A70|nr:penicillin-binding transpeptidase domain-containing protein [Heyndrickxia sporothermodurans]MED3649221.1 penicillin-binding transpeptidase domain-containing protein [Heyndrickxia sporothermodurans]MED3696656.1 penicillin-binding transpeptidase domain-containing protein [Heyndrickxia sporothermodurans]